MDESAIETTSQQTKAHVLTKSFHESDREPIGTLEQNMQRTIKDKHANPEPRCIHAGRPQSLNIFIMFYFVL